MKNILIDTLISLDEKLEEIENEIFLLAADEFVIEQKRLDSMRIGGYAGPRECKYRDRYSEAAMVVLVQQRLEKYDEQTAYLETLKRNAVPNYSEVFNMLYKRDLHPLLTAAKEKENARVLKVALPTRSPRRRKQKD